MADFVADNCVRGEERECISQSSVLRRLVEDLGGHDEVDGGVREKASRSSASPHKSFGARRRRVVERDVPPPQKLERRDGSALLKRVGRPGSVSVTSAPVASARPMPRRPTPEPSSRTRGGRPRDVSSAGIVSPQINAAARAQHKARAAAPTGPRRAGLARLRDWGQVVLVVR